MIVTATQLANDSNGVIDRVIERGEPAEIQRHGRTVAEISPKVGVSREELLRILKEIHWTAAESRELQRAMDAATEVFGYAGRG